MRPVRSLLLGLVLCACGPQSGARPLKEVRKETAALRSRLLVELERVVVFPHCDKRPWPAYACGLAATREAEQEIAAACVGAAASCTHERLGALYARIQARAESLDVSEVAVLARCGARCRDLRALELDILRTAATLAEQRVRAGFLRADNAEREGIEREREEMPPFVAQKKQRDEKLDTLFAAHERDVADTQRDGATLPHATLCTQTEECPQGAECMRFSGAAAGLCHKE